MEAIPMLALLLAMAVCPFLGYRLVRRRKNTSRAGRIAGALAGGLVAGSLMVLAGYVSAPAQPRAGYLHAMGFAVAIALLVALGLEGAERFGAWRSSEHR
jgi:hypothetical protein